MRLFIAMMVFATGLAFYAFGALLFDRRQLALGWLARRRARTGSAEAAGAPPASAAPVYLAIAACLVAGTVLVLGSCAGLVAF